ncbi:MAG: C1 family peptidase [Candidatus Kryptoniota bacterium]
MKTFAITLELLILFFYGNSFSQTVQHDTAFFVVPKNEFYDSIKTALERFYNQKDTITPVERVIRPDFSKFNPPKSVDEFVQCWHNPPISQGNTGTCWCFSTTSFLESEIYRLTGRKVKLSEMYTVYWEYVEKSLGYVRSRGRQEFGEGSEANAVIRAWKNHGIVPEQDYTGLLNGQPFHDHSKLFAELDSFLRSVKKSNAWDETLVENTVKSILNHYMGRPPEKINIDGKLMTPKEYLDQILKLNLDDYISLVSFSDRPYYTWVEYNVPDNWWHSKEYFNVPLHEFMNAIKNAVRSGYTMEIWGDVSEPGIDGHAGIAVIPSFDIPPQYIDANARIFRFYNHTTTDDHGIHLVGYLNKDGKDWYLIKDSGSSARNNNLHPGYYFYNEDYIKLKMLGIMISKSAIPQILSKMKQ